LKIVVNTRLLLKDRLEGIGWFSFETLKRITLAHPEVDFVFLFDRPYAQEFIFGENIVPVVMPPQARHPILFYIWFEFAVKYQLKKQKADLFLSPDGYLPLSTDVKSVAVIHDLNFEHYPKDVPFRDRMYYHRFFPKFAEKASRIATVSEYSKRDIIQSYGIQESKIDVVYNGANLGFIPLGEEEKRSVRQKYTGGSPFFIFIGSLHPRKNMARLFKAFDAFIEKNGAEMRLLIVGQKKNWTSEIENAFLAMKNKEYVVFTGRMPSEELHKVLASAFSLAYVPYFEGFGIPIMEAFYCGTPVITSNITSMPEISGDAACLVDPFSVESITYGLEKVYKDPVYRMDLIQKGNERKNIFTWDRSASLLWDCMLRALEEKY